MEEEAHVLYDLYCANQLRLNSCEELSWEDLAEEDKTCWRKAVSEFLRDYR